jgi:hypothetical protein
VRLRNEVAPPLVGGAVGAGGSGAVAAGVTAALGGALDVGVEVSPDVAEAGVTASPPATGLAGAVALADLDARAPGVEPSPRPHPAASRHNVAATSHTRATPRLTRNSSATVLTG